MNVVAEQTELREIAFRLEHLVGSRASVNRVEHADLLRRAADRLDRLTAYCADLEDGGDA